MDRIIIADDHSLLRKGLARILGDEYPDAEIVDVDNGEALLKEVALHNWDLVISDLNMPGKNGIEALAMIKLMKPDLPVLILSVYPEELYAVRVLKSGAAGYLNKGTAPEELIKAIRQIIAGKKYISTGIAERILRQLETETNPHKKLTGKEIEILKQLALGKTTTQIAQSLSLALTTVSSYRKKIMQKLLVDSNAELTRYAISHHIIPEMAL